MKRRSRYSDKVIAYVLAQRAKGVRWKDIAAGVTEEFGTKAPCERQMREWQREFGDGPTDPERVVREALVSATRAATPLAVFMSQKALLEKIPSLVEAIRSGDDPWVAGGVMILTILEETAGKEAFEKSLARYLAGRGSPGDSKQGSGANQE
ncbi:MAG: hypothetical protein DRI40_07450 [Chloroflexi bacterium]|nr:MAG: hypothetical protein DRI40_07450 [Chloroflexota bacterium]